MPQQGYFFTASPNEKQNVRIVFYNYNTSQHMKRKALNFTMYDITFSVTIELPQKVTESTFGVRNNLTHFNI